MIGLRVLHLATSLQAAQTGDVLTAIEWLKQQGHEVAFAAGDDAEIPGVTILRYRSGRASWWLGGKRALMQQVTEWRPDVVHLHGREAMSAARAIAKAFTVPILVSIDGILPPAKAKDLHHQSISWVLVPTEAHRAHYVSRTKLARDNVAQLPYAFDYQKLIRESKRQALEPQAVPVIGLFAEPNDQTLKETLTVIESLHHAGISFKLVIAYADADHEAVLREALTNEAMSKWCELTWCPHLGMLLPLIDIFVLSASERRVAPIIAAMGTGRVVIACANTGVEEIIHHDQTGIIVPCGNKEALQQALTNVLNDAALRERMGIAAQTDARLRFEMSVVGPALVELYHNAISALHHPENKSEGSRAYRRQITH
jgi:glycosyltransferase involved in cell wall biosynthesis